MHGPWDTQYTVYKMASMISLPVSTPLFNNSVQSCPSSGGVYSPPSESELRHVTYYDQENVAEMTMLFPGLGLKRPCIFLFALLESAIMTM